MQGEFIKEARRQVEICNACRYCEGYCSVFPEIHSKRDFSDGDITHFANLCHNCRGCYYACQYTAPHEFDLNLPKALAEVRRESWEAYAWPQPIARLFQRSGVALSLFTVICFAMLFYVGKSFPGGGTGFYAVLSHSAMVAIFLPAFLLPLVSLAISLRRYWAATGAGRITLTMICSAVASIARMDNLSGGHGDGCNFEDQDRFSHARRHAHQLVMWGFLLCFLSTASGTILHYGIDLKAPYGPLSLPKLFGVPGGLMMVVGTVALAALKFRAERNLADANAWGGELAFIVLLFLVASTGLALYWAGDTSAMPLLLSLHLGAVLAFFLLTPFTKMAHAPYRLLALIQSHRKG